MFDEDANKANDFEKQAMLSKFSVSQPALPPDGTKPQSPAVSHCCTFGQLTIHQHLC